MASSVTFTTTLGPDVVFKNSDGSIMLTPITSANVTFNTVDNTAAATGSGTVTGGVLELTFDVPKGDKGDQGDVGPAGPTATVETTTGTLTFSTDGSPIAYKFVPTAATTLVITGGVAGKLCEVILYLQQNNPSYAITLPSNVTALNNVALTNSANALSVVRIATIDGGSSYFMTPY